MKILSPANKILLTASDAALENLTHLAARVSNVPIALISFVDAESQWSKLILASYLGLFRAFGAKGKTKL